ncbi:MAG TPA: sugar ABC transporter permease [Geminicoccaceae bacterium]|nr:sugar ABC transporter permease [Geminicoccus sp.]HMU50915.1 sugar ABC transporter permease [Geminicoccaceae bacterium]
MYAQKGLWLFLVPSGLMISLVLLYPLGYAIYLSFFNYYLGGQVPPSFVGLGNYGELLQEPRFWSSLRTTVLIVAAAVGLEFALGLLVAFGLYKLSFGVKTFNLLLFLPHIVTPVVAALFLRWIFTSRWGLLDAIIIGFNVFPPDWLGSPGWARFTVVVADAWKFTPFMILVLYAGLNTVDHSQIESAQMDGAGNWTVLTRIMLPAIRPLIVFVLAIRTMDAFRFFDSIYVLTAGGPGTATETLTIYTYALAFRLLEVGKASALGVLTLLISALAIAALIGVIYRRERGAF